MEEEVDDVEDDGEDEYEEEREDDDVEVTINDRNGRKLPIESILFSNYIMPPGSEKLFWGEIPHTCGQDSSSPLPAQGMEINVHNFSVS